MTPLEMINKKSKSQTEIETNSRIDICFRNKEDSNMGMTTGSSYSLQKESLFDENSCLCLQTYKSSYLICHNVSNTCLFELITCIQDKWSPGISGVSVGVADGSKLGCALGANVGRSVGRRVGKAVG